MLYVGVFLGCLAIEYAYARWSLDLNAGRALPAVLWSVLCVAVGSFVTIETVQNYWLVLPVCLGHGAGTWAACRFRSVSCVTNKPGTPASTPS